MWSTKSLRNASFGAILFPGQVNMQILPHRDVYRNMFSNKALYSSPIADSFAHEIFINTTGRCWTLSMLPGDAKHMESWKNQLKSGELADGGKNWRVQCLQYVNAQNIWNVNVCLFTQRISEGWVGNWLCEAGCVFRSGLDELGYVYKQREQNWNEKPWPYIWGWWWLSSIVEGFSRRTEDGVPSIFCQQCNWREQHQQAHWCSSRLD